MAFTEKIINKLNGGKGVGGNENSAYCQATEDSDGGVYGVISKCFSCGLQRGRRR